ncbi:hypothetical protein GCM10007216_03210 [Thalassobacillus devorans]|uniref:LamG-like jellyroll fold domain-containing protein n=1 Tax=Thalassobacillus devorans TaxID=279813 RepID=A0ABQ1NGT0_9BACI|nr:GH32 C-terminal domain-containing protein [Thalassobacillus devorans]NIK27229.1 sucrose-6-phosphate hydrolase SacC (GH32 family) [Thalassobacillus devorans]GGC76017.1 hypothetical protein GCM10007216_03210 [Thalassobacillus devorans]
MNAKVAKSISVLIICTLVLALFPPTLLKAETNQESSADNPSETYRSQFHYSPSENWMNDPNGMVYYDGEYHLFYQHNPTGNQWGPMYWGHAVSEDLINWEEHPIALYPDENGFIWSGSVVVDKGNTAGFQSGDEAPMVAMFTHEKGGHQTQSLAYSNDKGRTWNKYEGNPVIEMPEDTDVFRDPKVFWHDETEKWVMVLSAGQSVEIYRSADLKEWEHTASFPRPEDAGGGVWEVPDLVELPVDGDESNKRWALLVSVSEGAAAGGSGMEYFVGDFDGKTFTKTQEATPVDYGADMYAGITWSNIPEEDGRNIMLGWMNNWQYAQDIPTEGFRGAMSLPRELGLSSGSDGSLSLTQKPVSEFDSLRGESTEWTDELVDGNGKQLLSHTEDLIEIEAEFDMKGTSAEEFGFQWKNSNEQSMAVSFNTQTQQLNVDRSEAGESSFSDDFAKKHEAPMQIEDGKVNIRMIVDRASIEVFGNDGKTVLTDQVFRDQSPSSLELYTVNGDIQVNTIKITELNKADIRLKEDTIPEDVPSNLENGNFETGDLSGWKQQGNAFAGAVSDAENYWDTHPFQQEGKYHVWGYAGESSDPDFRTGTLQSDYFKLAGNGKIEFLIGGGQDIEKLYVALVRAEDGKELFKATGANEEKYRRVSWDASKYVGKTLYLKVVDYHTDGFGHINVDDFQVYHEGEILGDTIENGDFETGDLTGWTIEEGDAFSAEDVTSDTDWGWGGPFNHQGDYHLWGAKEGGDEQTGVLKSSPFILSGTGKISFLIGGGNDIDNLYVALVRASDGKELLKATNTEWNDDESYTPVSWDASDYLGEELYIKVVDKATGGWGHINVDDFQVKQTGLLAHWPLNEAEGSEAKDEVTGKMDPVSYVFNDAEYKPSTVPLWREGLVGNALLFDGYSTWITRDAESMIQPEEALTIEGWVAPRSYEWGDLGQVSAIVNQHDQSKNEGYILGMGRHGKLSFQAGINGEWKEVAPEGSVLPKNEWSHIAATFNQSDQKLKLYLNGELVGETDTPENGAISPSDNDLLIGKHNQAAVINGVFTANMFNGLMDEIKISNEAKSAEEIKQGYREVLDTFDDNQLPNPDVEADRSRFDGDQHRPQYHFMPPEHWMNEPHAPIYYNGKYHIFYQKNPQGPYWHQIHWGHAVSDDMVHWEELPVALAPEGDSVSPDGVWSGSATLDGNGEPVLFFTAGDDSKFPNQMTGLAVSENPEDPDLKEWKMLDEPVTVQEEGLPAEEGEVMYGQFRDPFVWQDGDTWYQLVSSGIDGVGGTALLYSSSDLENWEYEKPFYTGDAEKYPKTGDVWELPVFLPLGKDEEGTEKYAFFINPWFKDYSPYDVKYTFYWIGTWDKEKMEFVPDQEEPQLFDYGEHFTGPSGMVDKDGTPILFSIAQDKRSEQDHYDAGWAHNAGLPIELSLTENNDLGIKPIEELTSLRGEQLASFKNKKLADANELLSDVKGDMLELVVEIDPKQADKAGIKVRQSENGEEETLLYFDKMEQTFNVDRNNASLDPDVRKGIQGGELTIEDENVKLHIYLDRSMIEAYANEQKSITTRVYPTRYDALGLELWSEGGEAFINSMEVWEMKSYYGEAAPVFEKESEPVPPHGQLPNHDFQTGDLTGWNIIEGNTFTDDHVTTKADWGWGGPFHQAEDSIDPERYHLWGFHPDAGGDAATGILQSDTFELGGNGQIDFLVGGGNNIEDLHVALVRASDGEVLLKETGRNDEAYRRVEWDASEFLGEQLIIQVTDNATGGWGHINVDDVNVPVALEELEQLILSLEDRNLQTSDDLDEKIDRFYEVNDQLSDLEEGNEDWKETLSEIKAEMIEFLEGKLNQESYQLTDDQLRFLAEYAIEQTGAEKANDEGKVQGYVMKRANNHVTGEEVREIVRELLEK